MSASNAAVWERLEGGLRDLSIGHYHDESPYAKLALAVIISGGKERDKEYLNGDEFLYHCKLAGLKSDYVQLMFNKAWHYIDNKIPLQKPEEDEYDEEDYL